MKNLKIFACLVTFFTLQVNGQNLSPTSSFILNETTSVALVEWKSKIHDFGEIPQNIQVTVDFEFRNTGKANLVISEVKASCGCTATGYPKQAIKPGATAKITATYNAKAKGNFIKKIQVVTNTIEGTETLIIKGTVI